MAVDATMRIRRAREVVHRVIEGEVVLLDLTSGRYFGLNATGAAFWEALGSSGATLPDAERSILSLFEVEPELLRRDLTDLIERLESERLVTIER